MHHECRGAPYPEACLVGLEFNIEFAPEAAGPPVVISTHHQDRHAASKSGQGGNHPDAGAGDGTVVDEPELEEIAGNDKTVPETGDGVKEGKQ